MDLGYNRYTYQYSSSFLFHPPIFSQVFLTAHFSLPHYVFSSFPNNSSLFLKTLPSDTTFLKVFPITSNFSIVFPTTHTTSFFDYLQHTPLSIWLSAPRTTLDTFSTFIYHKLEKKMYKIRIFSNTRICG